MREARADSESVRSAVEERRSEAAARAAVRGVGERVARPDRGPARQPHPRRGGGDRRRVAGNVRVSPELLEFFREARGEGPGKLGAARGVGAERQEPHGGNADRHRKGRAGIRCPDRKRVRECLFRRVRPSGHTESEPPARSSGTAAGRGGLLRGGIPIPRDGRRWMRRSIGRAAVAILLALVAVPARRRARSSTSTSTLPAGSVCRSPWRTSSSIRGARRFPTGSRRCWKKTSSSPGCSTWFPGRRTSRR